jgi:hypothetical protein
MEIGGRALKLFTYHLYRDSDIRLSFVLVVLTEPCHRKCLEKLVDHEPSSSLWDNLVGKLYRETPNLSNFEITTVTLNLSSPVDAVRNCERR